MAAENASSNSSSSERLIAFSLSGRFKVIVQIRSSMEYNKLSKLGIVMRRIFACADEQPAIFPLDFLTPGPTSICMQLALDPTVR